MSLTKDCFLHALIQLSKPASLLASIAFKWDPGKNAFVKMGPGGLHRHKVTTYVHALSVSTMLLQSILFMEKELSKILISSFGLIVIYFTLITVWVYHVNLDKAVALINDLIRTSEEFRNPNEPLVLDGKEKFIRFLAPLFHWSAMSVPFAFVGGVVWTMPCLNSSFGYYFLRECSSGSGGEGDRSGGINLIFLIFILVNLLLWSYSIQCAVFVVIGVEMLGAMSIRSFLKYYERVMLEKPRKWNLVSSKLPSAASSSTAAPINASTVAVKKLLKNSLIYRRIQILTLILNEIHSSWVLIPLLFTVSSHQVFSLYGIIKFQGQLNFVSYALFTILANQGVLVIMGMFTMLGDIHRMSVQVKRNLERAHNGHKWLGRYHKGCTLVKIRFGALNYVDSMTPLMMENFALSQVANMLLMN